MGQVQADCCCADTSGTIIGKDGPTVILSGEERDDCLPGLLVTQKGVLSPSSASSSAPKAYSSAGKSNTVQESGTRPVTIEFDADGEVKIAAFSKRPMGLTFENTVPLRITRVEAGSEAEEQGVQCRWVFKKVDGVTLEGMAFKNIVALMNERSVHLPSPR